MPARAPTTANLRERPVWVVMGERRPSNGLPISGEGRQVMVDDSTAGAARRPPFTSKAARPRLRNRRRRTDRPSSASSACSTASVSASTITRAHFVANHDATSQPGNSPAKGRDLRQQSKRSTGCNRRPRRSGAPPSNTTPARTACPSNALPISCEGRQLMLDDSTAGDARRPSFTSKAARPRLRNRRRRVDRPSSASSACSTTSSRLARPSLPSASETIPGLLRSVQPRRWSCSNGPAWLHSSADKEMSLAPPNSPPVRSTNRAQMVQPKPPRFSPAASLRQRNRCY